MLKHVPHSSQIDFTGWSFFGHDRLDKLVAHVCADAVRSTLMPEDDIDAGYSYLPWKYRNDDGIGGAKPRDPLTIYVRLPLGSTQDDHPTFSFSLNECIDEIINDRDPPDQTANIIAIRDALRAAVHRLDDAIEEAISPEAI